MSMSNILIAAFVMLLAITLPLGGIYLRVKKGGKGKTALLAQISSVFGFVLIASAVCITNSVQAAEAAESIVTADGFATGLGYLSAALSVGLSGIGGGIAVASSASAALGALSENEGVFGKSLIFVGMAEGVALYGLLIAFMIISNL